MASSSMTTHKHLKSVTRVIIEAEVAGILRRDRIGERQLFRNRESGNELPAPSIVTTGRIGFQRSLRRLPRANRERHLRQPRCGLRRSHLSTMEAVKSKPTTTCTCRKTVGSKTSTILITGCIHYTFEEYKIEPRYAEDIVAGFINGISEWLPAQELSMFPNPATARRSIGHEGCSGYGDIHRCAGA